MANSYMCQWGNCQSEKVAVSINYAAGQTRPRFCCTEHAAAWLIRQARLLHPQGSLEEITLSAVERTIASVAPPKTTAGEPVKPSVAGAELEFSRGRG